jgi:hypothetical protein
LAQCEGEVRRSRRGNPDKLKIDGTTCIVPLTLGYAGSVTVTAWTLDVDPVVHRFKVGSFPPVAEVTACSNVPPPETDQFSVRLPVGCPSSSTGVARMSNVIPGVTGTLSSNSPSIIGVLEDDPRGHYARTSPATATRPQGQGKQRCAAGTPCGWDTWIGRHLTCHRPIRRRASARLARSRQREHLRPPKLLYGKFVKICSNCLVPATFGGLNAGRQPADLYLRQCRRDQAVGVIAPGSG